MYLKAKEMSASPHDSKNHPGRFFDFHYQGICGCRARQSKEGTKAPSKHVVKSGFQRLSHVAPKRELREVLSE